MNTEYSKRLASKAVQHLIVKEDIIYGIFVDFISVHKTPAEKFTIFPQLSLKWKPEVEDDRRAEVPDFGIGHCTSISSLPTLKLRFGVEAKRSIEAMKNLPSPNSIKNDKEVMYAFHTLRFQAEDQAKAALKGRHDILDDGTIHWILLIGPYWVPEKFGPFTENQLSVRSHKKAESGDWSEQLRLEKRKADPPLPLTELFLLCEDNSAARLSEILQETDAHAEAISTEFMV